VDNLNDREEDKVLRVKTRFERVEQFIQYFSKREDIDVRSFGLNDLDSSFAKRFVPEISEAFGRQREWIGRRIKENREKYIEDTFFRFSENDAEVLNSLIEENTTVDSDDDSPAEAMGDV